MLPFLIVLWSSNFSYSTLVPWALGPQPALEMGYSFRMIVAYLTAQKKRRLTARVIKFKFSSYNTLKNSI